MQNIIPFDGQVYYYPEHLSELEANAYYKKLLEELPWQSDVVTLYGKTIHTKRKVVFIGNEGLTYTYSKNERSAVPWTPTLSALKEQIEALLDTSFNCCLANLYLDGKTGMGWHSDDERELQADASIASVSLGSSRIFKFRHKKTAEKISLDLAPGSLLWMKSPTQQHWQHALMVTQKKVIPRINLTFRQMA